MIFFAKVKLFTKSNFISLEFKIKTNFKTIFSFTKDRGKVNFKASSHIKKDYPVLT